MAVVRLVQFAAERSARLNNFDDEIRPIVEDALAQHSGGSWYSPIVDGAGVLWSEIFESESPTGDADGQALQRFLVKLGESLAKTAQPSDPPTRGEVDRVSRWVGTYTVNSATLAAGRDGDRETKTWIAMDDDATRSTHRAVDGQTVPIVGTFAVGGFQLQFPGEPVGPPEIWINCRCLLATTGGPQMGTRATSFAADAEEERPAEGDLMDEDVSEDEFVDSGNEVPWHGVLVVEGVATGDKRQFDVGALTYDAFPLPLTYQRLSDEGHKGSVTIGRIDEMWLDGNQHRARGMFNTNIPEANEVIDGLVFGMLGGVSVDVDSPEVEVEYEESEDSDEEDMLAMLFGGEVKLTHFTAGRIRSASMVQIPAFAEAYIALGPDFEEPMRDPSAVGEPDMEEDVADSEDVKASAEFDTLDEMIEWLESDDSDAFFATYEKHDALVASAFAPGTKDGPGWITNPRATQRLRSYWVRGEGAAKIRWGVSGDFNRCRLQLAKYVNPRFLAGTCANLHKEAVGMWPGRKRGDLKRGAAAASEGFALVASAASAVKERARFFENPNFTKITPITVDEEGRIFGHLALWGTCHLGIGEKCVMPPTSASGYAYYATGQVLTEAGFKNTGRIVMWTGHAGLRTTMQKAAAHYDDTGHSIADAAIGEDSIGIWFSGKVRDNATPEDIKVLRASALSGDWRRGMTGSLELIAILAVNTPGYAAPRYPAFAMDGGQQLSLLSSAGMLAPHKVGRQRTAITASLGVDDGDTLLAIGRVVADELEYRADRKERLSLVRDPELIAEGQGRRAARLAQARDLGD